MKARAHTIVSNDPLQVGYTYICSQPVGSSFDPIFKPQLTPKEMLELGVFSGNYFGEIPREFPRSWFTRARTTKDGSDDPSLNYFKVHASQTREEWNRKGWIHKDDPRGWFQWYCRYYLGRRHSDDARQIKRWRAISRHIAQIGQNCRAGDESCRRRQRQAVLHWAYDSRTI